MCTQNWMCDGDIITCESKKGTSGRPHSLYFKPEKCIFHTSSMEYLGLVLDRHQTCMDPVKVAGVCDWPTPTTIKGVHSFLGFCNYYQTFIQNFLELALPLNALTKKGVEFQWGDEEQCAFKALK